MAVKFRGAFLPFSSPGFLPGLITAVRAWAGSTAESAAATVAEKSAVDVLRPVQEINLVLQASKVLVEQDEVDSEGAPNVEMPADATDVSGYAEVRPEEVTGPTEGEAAVSESEAPLEEEASVGKEAQSETDEAEEPTAEEALDVVASSQGEDGTLAGNADQATEASAVSEVEAPREAGPDETGALEEESVLIGEATGHPAEADSGSDGEIIQAVVEPLVTSEAPVKDAGHCVSCHASDNAGEGVAPPGGLEVEVQQVVDSDSGESMDLAEATEGVSAVDGQLAESLSLVSAES
ncbi:unnamed protein product [Boreogadus saida]